MFMVALLEEAFNTKRRKPRMIANTAMNSLIALIIVTLVYGIARRSPVLFAAAGFIAQSVCEGAQIQKGTLLHIENFDVKDPTRSDETRLRWFCSTGSC